jgi:hypothetical protein
MTGHAQSRPALRRLHALVPWLWLVRPGAIEAAAPVCVVLFDGLPRLLVAISPEVIGRG